MSVNGWNYTHYSQPIELSRCTVSVRTKTKFGTTVDYTTYGAFRRNGAWEFSDSIDHSGDVEVYAWKYEESNTAAYISQFAD